MGRKRLLTAAAAAILLAAADTYVVVMALPAMMESLSIPINDLQRATPIISVFLLGYITVLPLLGSISDLIGRYPLLIACAAIFCCGSLVTACASSLPEVAIGRGLQGLGGGGLVPLGLALVADIWPPGKRGRPLGMVAAAQEFGSVIGPFYGAVLVTNWGWRSIFWINLPLMVLILVAAARLPARPLSRSGAGRRLGRRILVLLAAATVLLYVVRPAALVNDDLWGNLYLPLGAITPIPLLGWLAMGTSAAALWAGFPRRYLNVVRQIDWPGAGLLGGLLALLIIAFATANPQTAALDRHSLALVLAAVPLLALFLWWEHRAPRPLIAVRLWANRVSLAVILANGALGAALMSAVVDVPIFARVTAFPDSQLAAAAILGRLLIALPVGALLGGLLLERLRPRITAALGLLLAATGLAGMSQWHENALSAAPWIASLRLSDLELVLVGLGFGVAVPPLVAAMLDQAGRSHHALAASLTVVARMMGMLLGFGVLTTLGLHSFYATLAASPPAQLLCPNSPLNCSAADAFTTQAVVAEMHTIFVDAAICAALGAAIAFALIRPRRNGTGPNA